MTSDPRLRSKFDKDLTTHEGFVYRFERKSVDKASWRCVRDKRMSCRGRLWKYSDGRLILRQEHNHAPDVGDVEKRRVIQRIKEEAKRGFGSNSQIVAEQISELRPGASSSLPSLYNLKRYAIRSRKGDAPINPSTIQALTVHEEYQVDSFGKKFMR